MTTCQKIFPLCEFHRIREAKEREVFHRIKSLICGNKSSFRDEMPRIAENNFCITNILYLRQISNRLFL